MWGYRPLADFSQDYWGDLRELLKLDGEQLIVALAGQPVVFILDALHCQKNVEQIVEQQHDLIALKALKIPSR